MDPSEVYEQIEKESKFLDFLQQQEKKFQGTRKAYYLPPYTQEKNNDYYKIGGIEVIDFIKAKLSPEQYKGYLLGNIYKYSGRCQYKGEYQKDIIKLGQYTNWLLKEENESNPS